MAWITAVFRLVGFVALGAIVGWYLGDARLGALLTAFAVLVFWSLQIWRVQEWLQDSTQAPPDLHGVWGEIIARIYKSQRDANSHQERLQSTVDYLLDSFAAMRDGVVIVEGSGRLRWCNEAAQTLLGLRYPEDTGQPVSNIVRVPEFTEYLGAGEFSEPLVFETAGTFNLHLQLVVTRFAEGDTLLFVRDVTDKVRTEQMRRDFVGNVSHELRTPLTVISGYLSTFLAEPGNMPAPYVKALQQMAGQADRMENLLKDLLWLSRIESTERAEKREQVDMAALLDELHDEVSNMYPDSPLQLEVKCRDRIQGDYRELYSAVSNLVLNAFKYSPDNTPVLASWERRGTEFRLAVQDRGVGIDPSHFSRLTERFYRVDDSRSSTTGGTGLGLAIVKHVAAAHGGHLEIDSKLGEGSTFTLVFPADI